MFDYPKITHYQRLNLKKNCKEHFYAFPHRIFDLVRGSLTFDFKHVSRPYGFNTSLFWIPASLPSILVIVNC
ncbi:unnamed protein product [Pneumocystis jirovecii]|uniref:Uncharacterized protein n=1 Tax=Pneumocystis jirovecii TaxID=42068 RepID=L0P9D0_PNEJI|nr:unnamed protein product [Pneumocystis jirovecii]